ncbi:MAG: PKD domain-containing protein [Bacteroidetes bacterium]|nr:PKD domain-containing protein [Bacteroidota bacterium]
MKKITFTLPLLLYLGLCLPVLDASGQAVNAFQTTGGSGTPAKGNWTDASIWERWDGGSWLPAGTYPTSSREEIYIRAGDTVTFNSSLSVDQMEVEGSAQLTINGSITMTVANHASQDFLNSGEVINNGTIAVASSATFDNNAVFTNSGTTTLNNTTTFNNSGGTTFSNSGTFTIQNTSTFNNYASIDNTGGTIDINTSGVFANYAGGSFSTVGTVNVNSTGKYQHADVTGGTIPSLSWNAGSECEVTGTTATVPGGLGQTFQNFTWNCASQSSTINLAGALAAINGNFSFKNSGSSQILYLAQTTSPTINIGGDLNFQTASTDGDQLCFTRTGSPTVNISGNLNITGGSSAMTLHFCRDGGGSPVVNLTGNLNHSANTQLVFTRGIGTATLNISGNITVTANNSQRVFESSSGGTGNIYFANAGTQNLNIAHTGTFYGNINFYVNANSTVDFSGSTTNILQSTTNGATDFTVSTDGILVTGTKIITTVSGTSFTLSSGATLNTSNASGVNSTIVSGGTRTINDAANYIINGASTGFASWPTNIMNNLTIGSATTLDRNIEINGGFTNNSTFNASTFTVNLAGDFSNNSVFNANTGKFIFDGSTAQSIMGSPTFYDITVNNSGVATPVTATGSSITRVLDIQDGQLATGGNLTLLSASSGTAAIDDLSDGTPDSPPISGVIIAQRYISEQNPGWYMLASPETDAIFEDWNLEFYMSGFTGTDDPGSNFQSVVAWDEANQQYTDMNAVSPYPTNTSNTITSSADQSGYFCYIGNDGIGTNMPKTLTLTGTAKTGGFTISGLTRTAGTYPGWHMLGNPWAGPFRWGRAYNNGGTSNISATAKRQNSAGSYVDMVAGGADTLVASGEAFWVEATSGGAALEFQENDKVATGSDTYNNKHTGSLVPFKITLKQGSYYDAPLQIYFTDNHLGIPVSRNYDSGLDAMKFTNAYYYENLAAVVGGNNVSTNFIPDSVGPITVPLRFWKEFPAGSTKSYSLIFSNVAEATANNKCLIFEDTKAGVSFLLRNDTTYTVSMKDTTYTPRFFLNVRNVITSITTDPSCTNGTQGSVIAQGYGSGPFDYLWKDEGGDTVRYMTAVTTDTLGKISAGVYFLTVTNNGSCGTATTHFAITDTTNTLDFTSMNTDVDCYGNATGSITITPSSGTIPYTYNWSNGFTGNANAGLAEGTYSVTLSDSAGCRIIQPFTIVQPSQLTASTSVNPTACYGSPDGVAGIFVAGGTPPYEYEWSTGDTLNYISDQLSGTYTVTVTDARNCDLQRVLTVLQPDSINITGVINHVSCTGNLDGSVNVTVTGSIPPYTFYWPDGSDAEDINNLGPGNYTLEVTDSNYCMKSATFTITEPAPLTILSANITDISCNGAGDGSIDINFSGGTGPYGFLWSDNSTTEDIAGLQSDTFTVTVTDNNNCTTASPYYIIVEPVAITTSVNTVNNLCNGDSAGSADITALGGTGSLSFIWSSGEITEDISGKPAGNYSITVTDINSCSAIQPVTITEPPAITAALNKSNISCFGYGDGAIDLTATGGTGAYTYTWSNSATTEDISGLATGNYTVTVADNNNCTQSGSETIGEPGAITAALVKTDITCFGSGDGAIDLTVSGGTGAYTYTWSNSATTEDISGLATGNYTVTVADNNNCTQSGSETIGEPGAITAALVKALVKTDITCFGYGDGAIDLTVNGGTGAYTYTWSNSATTEDISGLAAATFTVTVADNNNCTQTGSETIAEPGSIAVTLSKTDITCFGYGDGAINLTASGGTGAYTFTWSNSATIEDISGLSVGIYTVTVEDNNNCTQSGSEIISEPAEVVAGFLVSTDTVFININGQVDFTNTSTGATGYLWDFGDSATSALTNPSHTYTDTGAFTVVLTASDSNNCTGFYSMQVVADYLVSVGTADQGLIRAYLAGDKLLVMFKLNRMTTASIEILNFTGQEVYRISSVEVFNTRTQVNLEVLPKGAYLVRIVTPENVIVHKFLY